MIPVVAVAADMEIGLPDQVGMEVVEEEVGSPAATTSLLDQDLPADMKTEIDMVADLEMTTMDHASGTTMAMPTTTREANEGIDTTAKRFVGRVSLLQLPPFPLESSCQSRRHPLVRHVFDINHA